MSATRLSVIRLPVLMYCLFPLKSAKASVLLSITFRKPFGPPTVLNIRPPGLAKACHIEGISSAYVFFFVGSKASWRVTHSVNPSVLTTAPISFLKGFHYRRENQGAKALCHLRPPVAARPNGQAAARENQLSELSRSC